MQLIVPVHKVALLAALCALSFMLSACDDSETTTTTIPSTYNGERAPALLSTSNVPRFVALIFGEEAAIAPATATQLRQTHANASQTPATEAITVQSDSVQADRALGQLVANLLPFWAYQARNVSYEETVACDSGSYHIAATIDSVTRTGTANLTYTNCQLDNVRFEGRSHLTIDGVDADTLALTDYTMQLQETNVTIDSTPYLYNGEFSVLETSQSYTLNSNMYRRNLQNGEESLLDDVTYAQELTDMRVTGDFCLASAGCVTVNTTTAFNFPPGTSGYDNAPYAGESHMQGGGGTQAKVSGQTVPQSEQTYLVVVLDEDGDNNYETGVAASKMLATGESAAETNKVSLAHVPKVARVGTRVLLSSATQQGQWTLEAAPDNSHAQINTTSAVSTLTVDQAGTYQLSLKTQDATGQTQLSSTSLHGVAPLQSFDFVVQDAVYSDALERLVMLSQAPYAALYVWNPSNNDVQTLALAPFPEQIRLGASGRQVWVQHASKVSRIDLTTLTLLDSSTTNTETAFAEAEAQPQALQAAVHVDFDAAKQRSLAIYRDTATQTTQIVTQDTQWTQPESVLTLQDLWPAAVPNRARARFAFFAAAGQPRYVLLEQQQQTQLLAF